MHRTEWLSQAVTILKQAGISSPELDARLLLQHNLKITREELLLRPYEELDISAINSLDARLQERVRRKPMSHILGEREFYGLIFEVTDATLDPRPDSETLIDVVQDLYQDKRQPYQFLDLGTGTGCLLLTLLHLFPEAEGVGIDISSEALCVAKRNAEKHHLDPRASWVESSWLDRINAEKQFDLIISNPPYIPTKDIDQLEPEVAQFEPRLALDGGKDGLDPYRHLLPLLSKYLAAKAYILFECGFDQTAKLASLMQDEGYEVVAIHRDLAGNPRAVVARLL